MHFCLTAQYTPQALNAILAKLTRLMTQEEVGKVRQKARELRGSYKPPHK